MHIVIMGCGRVGSALAHSLLERGHTVSIIDAVETAFRRLGADFSGETVTGVGFDREVLVEAGIERADGFAAVSSGDNSNIISARVVRETFGVETVVARIYDPRRASVYQKLGIPTVATVRWTADQVLRRLVPEGAQAQWREPSGKLVLAEVAFAEGWVGTPVAKLQRQSGARVAFLTRYGEALVPTSESLLQAGDLLHVICAVDQVSAVSATLAVAPRTEEHH